VLRDAATVLLIRDRPAGLEVYLLRRVRGMPFAGGMTAYPGGSVDPRDSETALAWAGPSPAEWAAAFDTDEGLARALVCAAVRETFEEAGVLLAGPPGGDVLSDVDTAEWEAVRRALLAREVSLAQALSARGLAVRSDLLRPWAHWITPEVEPRRYDTKFFVAAVPAGQTARDVSGEADEATWLRPADALAEHAAGTRTMLPPTLITLNDLVPHDTVAGALAAAPPRPITPVLPALEFEPDGSPVVVTPDGQRVRLPAGFLRGLNRA
jgi:8-oxo-dGTP pyrophosphatase MutT (NUDIX family)